MNPKKPEVKPFFESKRKRKHSGRLYEILYHVYPSLKIIEDETGSSEFQESFKKYVTTRRPQYNLLNEYDFDYCNSRDELLVQLADFIGGSINRSLIDANAPDYIEMLKGKILLLDEFPNKKEPSSSFFDEIMQNA